MGSVIVAVVALVAVVLLLSFTPILPVRSVQAPATSHISSDDIVRIADVAVGSPVLRVDQEGIRARLRQNPWVDTVNVRWSIDGTVAIEVVEREPYALVVMGSQSIAWYMDADGVWLEPSDVKPHGDVSMFSAALEQCKATGLLLIADVPANVNPQAGSPTTDAPIEGVLAYQHDFTPEFASQIAYYKAESETSLACVLASGVEISLGAPRDAESKETVIEALLAEFPNQLTYINVRVPSHPTYRKLDVSSVAPGSGVYGDEG